MALFLLLVLARLRLGDAVAIDFRPLVFGVAEAAVRRPALRLVEVEPMFFFCPRAEVPDRLGLPDFIRLVAIVTI